MRNTLLGTVLLSLLVALQASAQTDPGSAPAVPAVEHYTIRFVLDPEHHTVSGDVGVAVKNAGDRPIASVPFLLYRLMEVETASDAAGKPLAFTQNVVRFSDEPTWQVNAISVTLARPLLPGESATIHLKYGGALFGYPEVMRYVRDTISEDYSLLRAETMPYPMVAPPSFDGWRHTYKNKFDYEVETVVPAGYVAVCGGNDSAAPQAQDGKSVYRCAGDPGSSSINVAVSKFQVLDDPERHLRVYAMPADAEAGKQVMTEMRRALDFYASYLGPRACFRYGGGCSAAGASNGGLTLIEIPAGWGSYAMGGKIFQAAATFKDPTRVNELYHEVSHMWNARARDRVQRARYFDEAFATYFEGLAVRQFQGEEAFQKYMARVRSSFSEEAAQDARGRTTPMAEYGKQELGGFAYSKGAWSLYVLHQLLGEEAFRKAISEFLVAYTDQPADFDDFLRSLEKSSGRDLHPWFQQWILSGPESSDLLIDGKTTVAEMAARSRPAAPAPSK